MPTSSQAPAEKFWALVMIVTSSLFGLQLIRVLFPLTLNVLGAKIGLSTPLLGVVSLMLFLTPLLINLWVRWLGPGRTVAGAVVGIGLCRLGLQVPGLDTSLQFGLAFAGVFFLLIFWPLARQLAWTGRMFAIGFGLALVADGALLGLNFGIDLSWWPAQGAALLVAALVLAAWYSLGRLWPQYRLATLPPLQNGWAWLGLGPFLFLYFLMWQNSGRFISLSEWTPPLAYIWLTLSQLLGLTLLLYGPAGGRHRRPFALAAAVFLLLSLLPAWPAGWLAAVTLTLGFGSGLWLLGRGLSGGDSAEARSGRVSGAYSVSLLLLMIFTFIYYASYDIAIPLPNSLWPPLAGLVLGVVGSAAAGRSERPSHPIMTRAASLAWLLLLLPLAAWWRYEAPAALATATPEIRLMSFNIHNGFDKEGGLNLEDVAVLIAAEDADIVALQEVSRGWVVNGSLDSLSWLSQRLQMPYRFGANADPLIGLAILSRYPITAAGVVSLPPADLLFRRSYLWVKLDLGGESLTVVNLHAHHSSGADDIRAGQIGLVRADWAGSAHTVIVGDFNAEPAAEPLAALRAAGWISAQETSAESPLPTFPSPFGDRRIDYIWYSADLGSRDTTVSGAGVSDHLALTTTIEVEP